jgi:Ni,Fe-hydrogenase I small subunit
VGVGHGCIGCTEPGFWDTMTPFYERLPGIEIPGGRGIVASADSAGKKILGIAGAAVGIHAVVGIGKRILKGKSDEDK